MVRQVDRTTIIAALTLLTVLTTSSLSLRSYIPPSVTLHPLAGLQLLRDHKDLRWLLAASCLHFFAVAGVVEVIAAVLVLQATPTPPLLPHAEAGQSEPP